MESERTKELSEKAWRVVHSCKTVEQARSAAQYLLLLAAQYPQIDISAHRKELNNLFDTEYL